jgi:hypothetical protein
LSSAAVESVVDNAATGMVAFAATAAAAVKAATEWQQWQQQQTVMAGSK